MPTVKVRFPGGRYHATPWGHHVNEGLIEWPPSPWRLLRALVACGYNTQGWVEIPEVGQRLIGKLAAVLPKYHLPPASAAHSRHFMPLGELDKGREKTTLVFDTWANVGGGYLFIHWPCELDAEEATLFHRLVQALNYLGRSESWAEAEVVDAEPEWNTISCDEWTPAARELHNYQQVALVAAVPPSEYLAWRAEATEQVLKTINKSLSKKLTAAQQKKYEDQCRLAIDPYPATVFDCLTKETMWWKGKGWAQPPGSKRVLYWRKADALQVIVPPTTQRHAPEPVEWMLLALATPSGNKSALPMLIRSLPQAEMLRQAVISRAGQGQPIDCPSLIGKDENGPLHDQHEHAHFLPLNLDSRFQNRIDHFLVYAKGKLCGTAQNAIRGLKRTWTKGGVGDLQLSLVGSGNVSDRLRLPQQWQRAFDDIFGPPGGARFWCSVTPFVLPRYEKRRGKDTIEGQVEAELRARGIMTACRVKVIPERSKSLRHFIRRRTRGGVPPKVDTGYGVSIEFAAPVHGPILLGYASHFGLGRFQACDDLPC